ncbi:MAG: hypothetical protein PHP20_05920 [Firmicutes bacterium]|nr:hypothetical protein [Bacillota bacterium]
MLDVPDGLRVCAGKMSYAGAGHAAAEVPHAVDCEEFRSAA